MREILFRGKQIKNGKWVEGFLVKRPSAIHIGDYSPWYIDTPPKDPEDGGGMYNITPESIGQFIGLTDKNGKKIFEGDIVEWSGGRGPVCYGEFNCSCCDGVYGWYFDNGEDIRHYAYYEVIGNIYDNPEMLE